VDDVLALVPGAVLHHLEPAVVVAHGFTVGGGPYWNAVQLSLA
jgi:hypothetical protein